MRDRVKWIAWLAFTASALAVGAPYFLLSYRDLNLPDAVYGPQLGVVVAAAALTVGSGATRFWKGFAIIGASVPAVIMLRVVVEGIADPTSHNLWPFEIILGSIVSFPCAFLGAAGGWIIWKLRGRDRALTP